MIRWFLCEIKDQFFVKLSNFVSVTLKRIVGVLTRLSDAGVNRLQKKLQSPSISPSFIWVRP